MIHLATVLPLALLFAGAPAAAAPGGPAVGTPAPAFHLRDQSGKEQDVASLTGPQGLVLLFVRSADW